MILGKISEQCWRHTWMVPKRRKSRCCRERARYRLPLLNKQHPDPSTGLNESVIEFRATPMRVDENYSFYYVNLTRLIVTGIVPFGALAMLNFSIYRWVSILASKPSWVRVWIRYYLPRDVSESSPRVLSGSPVCLAGSTMEVSLFLTKLHIYVTFFQWL